MSIKFSQLPVETSVTGSTLLAALEPSGPTNYMVSLASISAFLDTNLTPATGSALGGVIVPTGSGIKVSNIGAVTINNVLHAFSFDVDNNLIYTQNTNTAINLTTDGLNSTYDTAELGTDQYAYSIDASGNLIATFSS